MEDLPLRAGTGLLNFVFAVCTAFAAVLLPPFAGVARGYIIGPPMSLDVLTNRADIIFKGTAISSTSANDEPGFHASMGFIVQKTDFKIVSVIKGTTTESPLTFVHYERATPGSIYEPQYYHFQLGRTYIVFAKRSDSPGTFQQLSMFQSEKSDQGALLCAGNEPVRGSSVKEVIWSELMAVLNGTNSADVVYAIHQLDEMSGAGFRMSPLSDFERTSVLSVLRRFMTNRDPNIAQEAIAAVGSHNPYMSEESVPSWLVTLSSVTLFGFAPMETAQNTGGELYWKDLVSIADSNADSTTRALAISALGLTREVSLPPHLLRWLSDPDPAVRSAATVLLADFPTLITRDRIASLASGDVRSATAREIGFAQQVSASDVAATLLTDPDADVRRMAAMSLLSFSPQNSTVAEIFKANLDNKEFEPLFLIALASKDPGPYLDALARTVEEKPTPTNGWGGNTDLEAWEILFKYLQSQPVDEMRSGKFDRYLDAMEKVGNYSSSEPRDIYAFYVQRGMTERAKIYRSKADKAVNYDLDQYFREVDRQFKCVRTLHISIDTASYLCR